MAKKGSLPYNACTDHVKLLRAGNGISLSSVTQDDGFSLCRQDAAGARSRRH